ncbi:MAG: 4Fe-4S binding protein [Desulfitobacteriia bacterium]
MACGQCMAVCPNNAIKIYGRDMCECQLSFYSFR